MAKVATFGLLLTFPEAITLLDMGNFLQVCSPPFIVKQTVNEMLCTGIVGTVLLNHKNLKSYFRRGTGCSRVLLES